eukprot:4577659-Pyramimonas_sp.AAC.1
MHPEAQQFESNHITECILHASCAQAMHIDGTVHFVVVTSNIAHTQRNAERCAPVQMQRKTAIQNDATQLNSMHRK